MKWKRKMNNHKLASVVYVNTQKYEKVFSDLLSSRKLMISLPLLSFFLFFRALDAAPNRVKEWKREREMIIERFIVSRRRRSSKRHALVPSFSWLNRLLRLVSSIRLISISINDLYFKYARPIPCSVVPRILPTSRSRRRCKLNRELNHEFMIHLNE